MRPGDCVELDEAVAALAERNATAGPRIRALPNVEPCIVAGLESARARDDWLAFECYVIAAMMRPDPAMNDVLCQVLAEQHEDLNNEDIVEALRAIAAPAAVPALIDASLWSPPWDEFHGLARKAMSALARIGTPEARKALEGFAETGPEEVRQEASELLAVLRR